MIRVVGVGIDKDLRALSRYLWQQGIPHRIIEESGEQVVFVRDESQATPTRKLVESFLTGELQFEEVPRSESAGDAADIRNSPVYRFLQIVFAAPVTSLLTLTCLLVALITQLGRAPYRLGFLFYPDLPTSSVVDLLGAIDGVGTFLRTLTPMFLHFGILHIVFNLLWLWYFGRQLEAIQSSRIYLLLVVFTSFAGNTFQYLSSGAPNFGGMSGVVYGLVGYAWVLHNFVPGKRLMMNKSLFVVFMVALVLMELVASNWIATAAHLGGVFAGLFAGFCVYLASIRRARPGHG